MTEHQVRLAKELRDAIVGSPDPALIRWVVTKIIEDFVDTNTALKFIEESEK